VLGCTAQFGHTLKQLDAISRGWWPGAACTETGGSACSLVPQQLGITHYPVPIQTAPPHILQVCLPGVGLLSGLSGWLHTAPPARLRQRPPAPPPAAHTGWPACLCWGLGSMYADQAGGEEGAGRERKESAAAAATRKGIRAQHSGWNNASWTYCRPHHTSPSCQLRSLVTVSALEPVCICMQQGVGCRGDVQVQPGGPWYPWPKGMLFLAPAPLTSSCCLQVCQPADEGDGGGQGLGGQEPGQLGAGAARAAAGGMEGAQDG
jgi:hypothetical protein